MIHFFKQISIIIEAIKAILKTYKNELKTFIDQPSLREGLDRFANNQYKQYMIQCRFCKERWFNETDSAALDDYVCARCTKELKSPRNISLMGSDNNMDPFHCVDNAIWQEYLRLPILSEVEKRLIAKRIIVFSVYRLNGGDSGCSGDAVNLPQDISEIVHVLPRGNLNSLL